MELTLGICFLCLCDQGFFILVIQVDFGFSRVKYTIASCFSLEVQGVTRLGRRSTCRNVRSFLDTFDMPYLHQKWIRVFWYKYLFFLGANLVYASSVVLYNSSSNL